ncbi:hypothetical protein Lal_00032843 [Lupinus albus]|nr:hypothetical protein Lal_00032843 [Lupinus albus]
MDPNMESSGRLCYEWFAQCTTFASLLTVHAVVPAKDKKIHISRQSIIIWIDQLEINVLHQTFMTTRCKQYMAFTCTAMR